MSPAEGAVQLHRNDSDDGAFGASETQLTASGEPHIHGGKTHRIFDFVRQTIVKRPLQNVRRGSGPPADPALETLDRSGLGT